MPNELDPIVDQWYLHRDKGEMMRVIAVESDAGLVEVQDFDGDIEELDLDSWRDMDIELAAEPEDWTGPFGDLDPADLGYTETDATPADRRPSLDSAGLDENALELDGESADELEMEDQNEDDLDSEDPDLDRDTEV
jgi:hypothetical protein